MCSCPSVWRVDVLLNFSQGLFSGVPFTLVGALAIQTSSELTKRLRHINLLLFRWWHQKVIFYWLLIWEKLHYSLSKIMNNKQVFVYGVFASTNDWRTILVGHIHFKKSYENSKIYWNISLLHDQSQEQEKSFI